MLPPLKEPPQGCHSRWNTSRAIIALVVLFVTLLGFNILQMLSLLFRPFSQPLFRRINRFAANTWWSWCVVTAKRIYGVRLEQTGDVLPLRENALVVANHQQMTDIPMLMALAKEKDRLGDLKWFVKKPIQYVPGVGWGMKFLDCLFVARNWSADRESVEKTFQTLVQHQVPFWLISFSEGTRITAEKLVKSRQFAESQGLPAPNHCQIPRTKGFVASVQGLRQAADAVYDVTIGYKNGVPNLWQYALGYAREAHLHIRRFPMSSLPKSDEDLTRWLLERFQEKDALLDHFYRHGTFPEQLEAAA